MNAEDYFNISRIEHLLLSQGKPISVSKISNFPFSNYSDLKHSHSSKDIIFVSYYNYDVLKFIGNSMEIRNQVFLLYTLVIIALINIILAFVFKEWILFLGIPFILIGFFSISPFGRLKSLVSFIGIISFIASFIFLDWTWSIIFGSMLFAQSNTWGAKEQYRMVIEEKALYSEVFFCYLFINNYLSIWDTRRNQFIILK